MANTTDWGAYYDQQMATAAGQSQMPTDPAAAAARRAQFIQQQQDPAAQAAAMQRNDQTNAYQIARDASLGMMMPGSYGANGVDYGKAQSDPSAALNAFLSSGYTGQQAQADGWGSSVGTPGWQSTPQSQHLDPNGGNMAATSPSDPNWGRQASQGPAPAPQQATGGGIYGQLGAQLGYGGGQQQRPSMPPQAQGGGYGPPAAGQGGNPYAALTGTPQGNYGTPQGPGGNPYGALSSYLDQRSQGGYGGPSHTPAQLYNLGTPKMVPQSSLQVKPNVLAALGNQLGPPKLASMTPGGQYGGAQGMAQMGAINPNILAALGKQLGTGQPAPRSLTGTPGMTTGYPKLSTLAGF